MDNAQDALQIHPHWNGLLRWLSDLGMGVSEDELPVQARSSPGAGYGLFALRSIEPSVPLFSIPAKALMNSLTLSPHYPRTPRNFTCTQYVSLHLLLHRPMKGHASADSLFGPYISILPQEFDSHPLTWLWKQEHPAHGSEATLESQLIKTLPPRVLTKLDKIANLFEIDWKTTQGYLQSNQDLLQGRPVDVKMEEDYLWAWLNVNTRCVYHRLTKSRSSPDNMTLCPVLDFANHTTREPHTMPRATKGEIWDTGPLGKGKFGDNFILLSPSAASTLPNEELFLRYGAHPNSTLFAEYGFVNAPTTREFTDDSDIELEEVIEDLFRKLGAVGLRMKEILVAEGYWGDWTMHTQPAPAHPSYRLITTLRLYHLLPLSATTLPPDMDQLLEPWRNTTLGKQSTISEENEYLWRRTLSTICRNVILRANAGVDRIRNLDMDVDVPNASIMGNWVKNSIEILWQEDMDVAAAVIQSLGSNIEF